MRFGAIDIGSNAVRLLIKHVFEHRGEAVFIKDALYRVPVRLGEEAFSEGRFSERKMDDLVKTMKAFRLLMEVQQVVDYRAYATSAMRSADNGEELVKRVRREAKVDIRIISGEEEASVILQSEIGRSGEPTERRYLYIDVGGGSTELAFMHKGQVTASRSFQIGTLRLLNDAVSKSDWSEVKEWLEKNRPAQKHAVIGIGSGGNINKLVKMYSRGKDNFLTQDLLFGAYEHLSSLNFGERVRDLGLKPDRADVIVPAADIFRRVLKWTKIHRVIVPKFGIADGTIRAIYSERKAKGLVAPKAKA
jgi:exopolyphosphatase/guanosine-5'-triphosphate,3'-diphosphate pyrophosphatase